VKVKAFIANPQLCRAPPHPHRVDSWFDYDYDYDQDYDQDYEPLASPDTVLSRCRQFQVSPGIEAIADFSLQITIEVVYCKT